MKFDEKRGKFGTYGDKKTPCERVFLMGGIGLEPTTFAMSTQRSNQLS